MYRRFVEDFSAHSLGEPEGEPWTRETVLEEALRKFGVQSQYEHMMAKRFLREREAAIWDRIKASPPLRASQRDL